MTRVIRYRMANAVDFCPQALLPTCTYERPWITVQFIILCRTVRHDVAEQ